MREKKQQVLLPCIEFPGFKKITLESGIKSESLKREAAEQQLPYISYKRQYYFGKLHCTELHELTTFSIVLSVQWPLKVEVLLIVSYISETLHAIF